MACFDWYGIAASYPRTFAVGDMVKVHVAHGKGGFESWSRIVDVVDADHFLVKSVVGYTLVEAALREAGTVFTRDGQDLQIVHVDDLKSEAQAREESYLYHMEEAAAGLL